MASAINIIEPFLTVFDIINWTLLVNFELNFLVNGIFTLYNLSSPESNLTKANLKEPKFNE